MLANRPIFQKQSYMVVVPTPCGGVPDKGPPAPAAVTCLGGATTQYTKTVKSRVLRYRYYRDLECETSLVMLVDLIDSLHRFGVSDLDIAVKANFTVHVLPTGKSARLDDLRFLNRNGSDVTVISVKWPPCQPR